MKKSFTFIFLYFIAFILWGEPIYLEVEPGVFKWLEPFQTLSYDKNGKITKVENDDHNIEIFYEYDEKGNLISEYASDNPNKKNTNEYKDGLISKQSYCNGTYTLYHYDDNNNLIRLEFVDPNNKDKCEAEYFEYDARNNLVKSFTSESKIPKTYTYDNFDRVIKLVDEDNTTYQQYDDKNNITTSIIISNNFSKIIFENHKDKNNNNVYQKCTSRDFLQETWYINEYYEDGKSLKKVSQYRAISNEN